MRVVLAQLAPVPADPAANADRVVDVLAGHPGADLAVFPELFVSGYALDRLGELAGRADAAPLDRVARAAAAARTAVVVGFAERTAAGVANSLACFDVDGRLAAVYRKTHLFGPGERAAFAPGDRLVLVRLAGIVAAPLICFDVEFPEPARALARGGGELLVTAAANMGPYSDDHELAARARALDNRRPHVYVNRVGFEHGLDFVGGSRAIDAAGRVIAEAGDGEEVFEARVEVGGAVDPAVEYLGQVRAGLAVDGPG